MDNSTEFFRLINETATVPESRVQAVFDALPPFSPELLVGDWKGGYFPVEHPGNQQLKAVRWAGKHFYHADHVEPVIIYNENNERVWNQEFGTAVLRQVLHRGVVSTCMIYDTFPILDHFRRVDNNTVMGAMDSKMFPKEAGTFYFYLVRLQETK